jgi:hypothetical protein
VSRAGVPGVVAAGVAAALLVLSGCGGGRTEIPKEYFGVDTHNLWSFHDKTIVPAPQREALLDEMGAGGVEFARMDLRWGDVEPNAPKGTAHRYRWDRFDLIAEEAARHGIRLYALLYGVPAWTGKPENAGPADPAAWSVFAGDFAKRYGRDGSFWEEHAGLPDLPVTSYEIWNEENAAFFWSPVPDPSTYARLYLRARQAIRAADPSARVVFGGLVGNQGLPRFGRLVSGEAFVRAAWTAVPALRGNVDAIGFHAYDQTVGQRLTSIARFRATLSELGEKDLPIDVNETGWPTRGQSRGAPQPVADDERAALYADLFDKLPRTNCGIEKVAPYEWVGGELAAGPRAAVSTAEWFGLFRRDGSATAAGTAYAKKVREWEGGGDGGKAIRLCGKD